MNEIEIKVISYEEARLTFFKEQRERAQSRYENLQKTKGFKELPPMEQHRFLSVIGERLSYWNDIVEMLEKGDQKQSEGEWYVNYMMSKKPSKRGRTIQYTTYTCSVCGKPNGRKKSKFCPNCGAKMKGGAE